MPEGIDKAVTTAEHLTVKLPPYHLKTEGSANNHQSQPCQACTQEQPDSLFHSAFQKSEIEISLSHNILNMVPKEGVEPSQPEGRWILNPVRLPVPPLRR